MASGGDSIKSFFVTLGYEVDESSQRKFLDAIVGVTKSVSVLAASIVGAAAAVVTSVTGMAESMEKMYYLSQRTKDSVQDIEAFAFSFSKLGASTDTAKQAVAGLSQYIKSNYSAGAVLQSLTGLPPGTDPIKYLEALGPKFRELAALGQMPRVQAYAETFHIPPDILQAMLRGGEREGIDQYNKRIQQAGIDLDAIAKRSRDLMNAYRDVYSSLSVISIGVLDTFQVSITNVAERLSSFLDEHSGQIIGFFKNIQDYITGGDLTKAFDDLKKSISDSFNDPNLIKFLDFITKTPDGKPGIKDGFIQNAGMSDLMDGLDKTAKYLDSLNAKSADLGKATREWVSQYIDLSGMNNPLDKLNELAGSLGKTLHDALLNHLVDINDILHTLESFVRNGFYQAWQSTLDYISSKLQGIIGFVENLGNKLFGGNAPNNQSAANSQPGMFGRLWNYLNPISSAQGAETGGRGGGGSDLGYGRDYGDINQAFNSNRLGSAGVGAPEASAGQRASLGSDTAKHVIQYLRMKGWSMTQAAGIAANIYAESAFNPSAVGDNGQAYGLGQWHPDRQARFQRVFGKSIRGSSLDEQLEFYDWELHNSEMRAGNDLKKANTIQDAVNAGLESERPANMAYEQAHRGNFGNAILGNFQGIGGANAGGDTTNEGDRNVNQVNHVTINGAGDPKKTGDAVRSQLDRHWGDLVYSTMSPIQ